MVFRLILHTCIRIHTCMDEEEKLSNSYCVKIRTFAFLCNCIAPTPNSNPGLLFLLNSYLWCFKGFVCCQLSLCSSLFLWWKYGMIFFFLVVLWWKTVESSFFQDVNLIVHHCGSHGRIHSYDGWLLYRWLCSVWIICSLELLPMEWCRP